MHSAICSPEVVSPHYDKSQVISMCWSKWTFGKPITAPGILLSKLHSGEFGDYILLTSAGPRYVHRMMVCGIEVFRAAERIWQEQGRPGPTEFSLTQYPLHIIDMFLHTIYDGTIPSGFVEDESGCDKLANGQGNVPFTKMLEPQLDSFKEFILRITVADWKELMSLADYIYAGWPPAIFNKVVFDKCVNLMDIVEIRDEYMAQTNNIYGILVSYTVEIPGNNLWNAVHSTTPFIRYWPTDIFMQLFRQLQDYCTKADITHLTHNVITIIKYYLQANIAISAAAQEAGLRYWYEHIDEIDQTDSAQLTELVYGCEAAVTEANKSIVDSWVPALTDDQVDQLLIVALSLKRDRDEKIKLSNMLAARSKMPQAPLESATKYVFAAQVIFHFKAK